MWYAERGAELFGQNVPSVCKSLLPAGVAAGLVDDPAVVLADDARQHKYREQDQQHDYYG